jgi:hypothetical protein
MGRPPCSPDMAEGRGATRTCQCRGDDGNWMKAAFTLLLIALMILPAALTARIMLWSARRKAERESENGHSSDA